MIDESADPTHSSIMHELSLASMLAPIVLETADQHNMATVTAIHVHAGQLRGIVPEAFDAAMAVVLEDTIAHGAAITLTVLPLTATCRGCGEEFSPSPADYRCPACSQADAELVQGDELIVHSIEGSPAQPAPDADFASGTGARSGPGSDD